MNIESMRKEREKLQRVGDKIKEKLESKKNWKEFLGEHFTVEVTEEGLKIELTETAGEGFFALSTAVLNPEVKGLISEIGTELSELNNKVIIEGHTDSVPMGAATHHQLSSGQALAVFDVMTQRGQMPAKQLFTIGYGANHPRASNTTPSSRARNRRIEIVVYPETVSGS